MLPPHFRRIGFQPVRTGPDRLETYPTKENRALEPVPGAYVPIFNVEEVQPGVEPGLPRLPGRCAAKTLPDRRVAEAGFEPAWERLMRPCWNLPPVHSADQYSRQDSNLR